MNYMLFRLIIISSIASLNASSPSLSITRSEEKLNIVPMGMGVMQICFTQLEQDQKIARVVGSMRALLDHAVENQKVLINTALIYGMQAGDAEKIVADALEKLSSQERAKIILVTWVGLNGIEIEEEQEDFSLVGPSAIYTSKDRYVQFIEESFVNLRINSFPEIELWVGLHRIDTKENIEVQAKQLARIGAHPSVSRVGLSEVAIDCIEQFAETVSIGFLETELSLSRQFALTAGILDYCRENGIIFLAYSPLDRGIWTSKVDRIEDWIAIGKAHPFLSQLSGWSEEELIHIHYKERAIAVAAADRLGVPLAQVALAWIIKVGAIPIPDSTNVKRCISNFMSLNVELDESTMNDLNNIMFQGKRYK